MNYNKLQYKQKWFKTMKNKHVCINSFLFKYQLCIFGYNDLWNLCEKAKKQLVFS